MKVIKIILLILLVLAAFFFVVGLLLPSEWKVSRSMTMSATPAMIYPHVANLKDWPNWSPWNYTQDPTLKYTYEGPEIGVGTQQNWTSEKMGTGWLKIVEANPEGGISYDLFIDMKSFQSTIHGRMDFVRSDEQTVVIWTDSGDNGKSIFKKWLGLLMGPMLGKELDLGLANLKKLVESNL